MSHDGNQLRQETRIRLALPATTVDASRDLHVALSQLDQTIQSDLQNVREKLERFSENVSGDKFLAAPRQRRRSRRQRVSIPSPRAFQSISAQSNRGNLGSTWTVADFLVALICGFGVTRLRNDDWVHTTGAGGLGVTSAVGWGMVLAFVTALCIAGLSRISGLHDLRPHRTWLHEQALILWTVGLSTLGVDGAVHLLGASGLNKNHLALNILLTVAVMSLSRTLWRRRTAAHFERGIVTRNFIIAGADPIGCDVRDYLTSLAYLGYSFKGFVSLDDTATDPKVPAGQLLGKVGELIPLCKSLFVDEIIFSKRPGTATLIGALDGARATGIDVRLVPSVSETLLDRTDVHYVGDLPTIVLHQRHTRAASLFVKRLLDLAAAASGIALTSPLWIAIAVAIKLGSPGPLFYASNRVGFKGRIFPCYKFRTMVTDAEKRRPELDHLNEREGILFKITNDPRITAAGKFLRKYSLDELPQLWNVLRGDMSMVGPRPPISSEVAQYEIEHLKRLEVTPGITGLWQVEARQRASFDNYIELDRAYISNWSLGLDLKILLRTVRVVLTGTGS